MKKVIVIILALATIAMSAYELYGLSHASISGADSGVIGFGNLPLVF
jgi:hypothetical protein